MNFKTLLQRLQKSPPLLILVIALIGSLLTLVLNAGRSLTVLELKSLDFRFLRGSHPEMADTSIVLAAIDQNSLDFFAKQEVNWPWPREYYGVLVDYLNSGGARVIAFDMVFDSRDVERLEADAEESDRAFADAMKRAGNVVLAAHLAILEEGDQQLNKLQSRHIQTTHPEGILVPVFSRATAPLPEFQEACAGLGIVNFETDVDGTARRVPLEYGFENGFVPYFALSSYCVATGTPLSKLDSVVSSIHTSNEGDFIFNWYGKGGPSGTFRHYSVHALILSALKMKQGLPPDVPPSEFAGKSVIIGASAAGLMDFKPTPFTSIEPYPGMEIHATMLSNLLKDHYITQLPDWFVILVTLLLSIAVAAIFYRSKSIVLAVSMIIAIGLAYFAASFFGFSLWQIWIPVIGPAISMVLTFAISAVVSYATEGRQKRQLRKAFNRYLSPTVVTEIMRDADQIELGGKLIEGTVYFSDIKNFTTFAEQLSPKDLVAHLNEYFSLASDLILRNDAMLDKYIGDAIMAIFGAPVSRTDHAKTACLTSLEVHRALSGHYGGVLKKSSPQFVTRIGPNTGKMIVGNIGSTTRLDYTAIGDTVNLASRLEGVNKYFGTNIIISESTYRQAKDWIEVRELDLIRVKGKNVPIRIYELVGERGTLESTVAKKLEMFSEGLTLYRAKKWRPAARAFQAIGRLDRSDGPSATYIERCKVLSGQRLPARWDGVYTMTSK